MEQKRIYSVSKSILAVFLAAVLLLGGFFLTAPKASATALDPSRPVTVSPGKGLLFLEANVHRDFYDVLYLTLNDKSTNKEFTLKVEGGGAFEVNIQLPIGEYGIVDAYIEKDDSYEVTCNKTDLVISPEATETLTVDIELKPEIEIIVPGSEPTAPEESPEGPVVEEPAVEDPVEETPAEEVTQTEAEPEISEPADEPEEPAPDEGEENTEEDDSNGVSKIIWHIVLSVMAAAVFFVVIGLVVLFVRRRLHDE